MVIRLACVVLVIAAGIARADNPKLADARAAIEQVHYPEARTLLAEALASGGNSPAEVREIYRLSASTAAALGNAELAEQFYRRWLALDPHASLAAGDSPKLQAPFVAAQGYIEAHGGLVVRIARDGEVTVTVVADPLAMAIAAASDPDPPVPFGADHLAHLPDRDGKVAVVDEHGNHLVELDVPAAVVPVATPAPAPAPQAVVAPESHRWRAWAIPAGTFTAAAVGFGIVALAYEQDVRTDVATSGDHFASDVDQARDRSRLYAYIAAGALAVGIGFAIPTIYFYPKSLRALVTPSGIAIAGRF